jgi:SAM-dependent methyltransferase
MADATTTSTHADEAPRGALRDLFLISVLILFLELACIRWFPAHVLYLTFFTNTVLLASFLGMSVGCLAANHSRRYLRWTPSLLAIAVMVALIVEVLSDALSRVVDVGNQVSPQLIFFGTEYQAQDIARFAVPIEVLAAFFFVIIALVFIGPGQELGRALNRVPHRVHAYSLNILGSVAGIVLFAACSWFQLPPFWWFLPCAIGLAYFLRESRISVSLVGRCVLLVVVAVSAGLRSGTHTLGDETREYLWSPYYRIDYDPPRRNIATNLLSHQGMVSTREPSPAYALPHLLNRDAGRPPFGDVLIIGAGSGNDVSRALQWGARHVDAVEIDPVIHDIGRRDHPDNPYADPRVTVHLDDGRNFLRTTDRKYDLVIYALVDSLVLQSSYSSIRLESYLFTRQAFADIRDRLKPDGLFVTYNFFRQGWVVARIDQTLRDTFGSAPLLVPLPYRNHIEPDDTLFGEFDVFLAGDVEHLRRAFATTPAYWLHADEAPSPATANGFAPAGNVPSLSSTPAQNRADGWLRFGLATVGYPAEGLRPVSDDWPFLYLRHALIPDLNLRGMAMMGVLALLIIFVFLPRGRRPSQQGNGKAQLGLDATMFFLGAGFMLVETKAVVHMALLFGSTWIVNSIVFFAILLMILGANLWVLRVKPARLLPYQIGLFAALAISLLVPLDSFLGMDRSLQIGLSSLVVFAPILFAGVIFAVSFSRGADPGRAFGANIAGAILGGLAENASMVLGFQYLVLVAAGFYAFTLITPIISAVGARASTATGRLVLTRE